MNDQDFFVLSVENMGDLDGQAVMTISDSAAVFREQGEITPVTVDDSLTIIPWGADNLMPFNLMDRIDRDETLSTCMNFTAEACYASGLEYRARKDVPEDDLSPVATFCEENNLSRIYLGQCMDMKMFDFCVSVIVLDKRNEKIVRLIRKNAAYCRFSEADAKGHIRYVAYANWRRPVDKDKVEVIPMLDPDCPLADLRRQIKAHPRQKKYAIVSMVPKASSTYYPIPAWGSIFKGAWYDIKQLIGVAKKAKLKNSAPIKYHIEVDAGYWARAVKQEGIVDPLKAREFIKKLKEQMIEFLSGAENSGKVLFSSILTTPDGKEIPEVRVTKLSTEKEGGDYTTDIQEAVNMICFAMRVHSNLVGSVPGKSQSNNSGSDKRELYNISQSLQKAYRDIVLESHRLVCAFNGWNGLVAPTVDLIMLTTLDKHTDAVSANI